jgi:ASC-1-like (ASCH) protein
MEHVAIMKKSWGLTDKVLDGEKKIESRWYSVKYKPWDRIEAGETIYFKDSGEPVAVRATVRKVLQFADLVPEKVKKILDEYGGDDGIASEKTQYFFEKFKNKKYCILIFLKDPVKVKSFNIDKTGFGAMSSWITVDNVLKIRK